MGDSASFITAADTANEIDEKTKLEFLRIATMIGQKIDVIWVTFLTTYVTLFGFALFYDGGVKLIYFAFIVLTTATFTWINFRSLWHHYRFQNEMGRLFQEMNSDFPSLNPLMSLYHQPRSERVLIYTHLLGFSVYTFFIFEKFILRL